jgi:tight adherence protein B
MLLLVCIFVFLAVAGLVFSFASLVDLRHERARLIRERLSHVTEEAQPEVISELLRDQKLSDFPSLHRLLARLHILSGVYSFVAQADPRVRAGNFLALVLASGLCGAVLGVIFVGAPLAWAALALAGASVPFLYLARVRRRRMQKFEELFPQAIELLARAVRAGHAFTTALEMVGSELNQPVSGEFRKVFEEQKFGLAVRDALHNLAKRVPLTDVKFFVTAVLLQRETGGNLAEVLDKLSYVIRERFKLQRQVRVFTAQGRLTMIILMCLPPALALGITMLNPHFIRPLFEDRIGHVLLLVGITLQVIGFFLIRRIIRIQV